MKRSRIFLISSMVIFGTIGLFVRGISLPAEEIALYRSLLAILLVGVFMLLRKKGKNAPKQNIRRVLPLLFLSGAALGFNWILLFEAYKYTTVAIATLSYYFAPVIVTLVCPILFREKLTGKQIVCFVMSTVGLSLVIGITNLGSGGRDAVGIAFGLGAAVLYATVILLNKFIKGVTGIRRTLLQFLAAVMVLIPYVLLTSGVNLGNLDGTGWVCLLIVGLVHTGITYCLYFTSLKELSGQEAAILSYMDPLVAVLIGVLVLKEPLNWQQLVGGGLILGFTLLNELDI